MKHSGLLRRCLLLAVASLISVPLAVGQGQGGSQGGGGGGQGGGSTGGGSTGGGSGGRGGGSSQGGSGGQQQQSNFPGRQQQSQVFQEMRRPMYLQGKVVFEDGTPAPPNVVIERVCDGRPIPEDYTDTKGRFSFQIGQNSAMIPDASYSGAGSRTGGFGSTGGAGGMFGSAGRMDPMGGVSERELMGCELRANLAGYRSSSVELTGRRMFDNPDVGTIVLHSIAGAEGSTISFSSLNAPKKARKAYNNGRKEVKKKKPNWAKAEKELVKALEIYPEYASAWFILGQVHEAQKRPAEARDAYGKALAADEKYVNPYLRIALMDAQEQKWGDVRTTTNRILELNPYHFPDAYFYNSIANLNLNNLSAAEKSAREAINLNAHRKFPQVEQILGIVLAQQNNYEEAAVHLKKYLELVPDAQNADMIKTQISEIEAFLAQNQEAQPQQ